MNQFISKSLSQIVIEKSQTASVFEKYQLDYCCKGKRSLEQACAEQNVSVDQVVADLLHVYAEKKTELDFTNLALSDLSDYIVKTHHSYVKREMPLIVSYFQKVVSKHGSAHPELIEVSNLFDELSKELNTHLRKEEDFIFPAICKLESNSSQPASYTQPQGAALALPVIDLENEHEHAGDIMSKINQLTNNYTTPPNSCTTFTLLYASLKAFELDLHQHVHLENGILFPKALILDKERQLTTHN